jgi:ribosomal protein L11 methyltransferase
MSSRLTEGRGGISATLQAAQIAVSPKANRDDSLHAKRAAMTTTLEFTAGAHGFGDGNHPTTRGVLAAINAIDGKQFKPRTACDMGAGSGIVAMAVAQKFNCPVVAVDIEASAVETITRNAERNTIRLGFKKRKASILPIHADGFAHPDIAAHAPYDLIVANILAEPLLALAKAMEQHLAPEGVLILSGILAWQEAQIREAYEHLNLEKMSRITVGEWVTLCWGKP